MVEAVLTMVGILFQNHGGPAKIALADNPGGCGENRQSDKEAQHQVGAVSVDLRTGMAGMCEQREGRQSEKTMDVFHRKFPLS
jgi:hypothetical protein